MPEASPGPPASDLSVGAGFPVCPGAADPFKPPDPSRGIDLAGVTIACLLPYSSNKFSLFLVSYRSAPPNYHLHL